MSSPLIDQNQHITAARIMLSGLVQGLGIRPSIARLARQLQLTGSVRNDSAGVLVHIEGTARNVDDFCHRLPHSLPAGARLDNVQRTPAQPLGSSAFHITESCAAAAPSTAVPPDIVVCELCHSEILDPANRRHLYPFTTCTDCGPRYSLIDSIPYDRVATAMQPFSQCPDCLREYQSPDDRRFHSQTNACAVCGPHVAFFDTADLSDDSALCGQQAIAAAARFIRQGKIVALKGVGGFQLICDATSTTAIEQLRQRKHRPQKPLAVMVASLDHATQLAHVNATERAALTSPANPIVLLQSRSSDAAPDQAPSQLSPLISPNLRQLGLLLPSTALHTLLSREVGVPCVVTSGNVDGEPLAYCDDDFAATLPKIADACLTHNRQILRPIDDSVIRCVSDQQTVIRAARGMAPLPLNIATQTEILAVAGHQKVAVALSNGRQSVLGPHLGDLDSVAARQRFVEQVGSLKQLYGTQPAVIAHDMHPDFFTTRWAQQQNAKTIAVQHHHAHIVAGMVQHGWLDRQVLGVAFDGTGFGTDGTIWGGEFLLCSARSFTRQARFRPFVLPAAEQAIREPWRIALALVQAATDTTTARHAVAWVTKTSAPVTADQVSLVSDVIQQGSTDQPASASTRLFPLTSSVGRLFDGVASLLLHIDRATFEGEPAMRLEAACDRSTEGEYELRVTSGELPEIDWRPMIRQILTDLQQGIPVGTIARLFTRTMARAIQRICAGFSDVPLVLSGGCFQNAILTEETLQMLQSHPQPIGQPDCIPVNDGGLAAGQLAVAAAHAAEGRWTHENSSQHSPAREML